jgi:hypothetical protein
MLTTLRDKLIKIGAKIEAAKPSWPIDIEEVTGSRPAWPTYNVLLISRLGRWARIRFITSEFCVIELPVDGQMHNRRK